jgi:hypothetical protein
VLAHATKEEKDGMGERESGGMGEIIFHMPLEIGYWALLERFTMQ